MAERETGVASPRCDCLCHTGEASHVAPCKCLVGVAAVHHMPAGPWTGRTVADGAADPRQMTYEQLVACIREAWRRQIIKPVNIAPPGKLWGAINSDGINDGDWVMFDA